MDSRDCDVLILGAGTAGLKAYKAAIARGADAPRHLVLGAWGFKAVVERMEERVREIAMQRDLSLSADFDDAA